MKNNYFSKFVRTLTAVFPVKERKGSCKRCGGCCKLPNTCRFLDYDRGGAICKAYNFRPLNCRKYPRSAKEHITPKVCGYYFQNDPA